MKKINTTQAIALAIRNLGFEDGWVVRGENIDWNVNVSERPTQDEIVQEIERLKAAEPMRLLRVERDRLIAETDWWVLPDRTPTSEQLAYRQALRDLPDTSSPVLDPTSRLGISGVSWPVKP
jgi:hypothetical protein